jgi:hypothetical protein
VDIVLSVCIGIALAATCGFRIFIPLLALSIAGMTGFIDLGAGFQWMGTLPAVIIFGAATVAEVLAYFIPIVDNILDAASVPLSAVAGAFVAAAAITEVSPGVQWTLAIVAGGGLATATSLVSNAVHAASTLTTGGAANPAVSAVESTGSAFASILAIVVPILAVIAIAIGIVLIYRYFIQPSRKRRGEGGAGGSATGTRQGEDAIAPESCV